MKIRAPEGYSVHGQVFNRHERIIQIVNHLVQKRDVPVDIFTYECMMDAMVDPQGSAKGARALLKEMEQEKMPLTDTICRSALAALAVHPDYALRLQVLDYMKEHWLTLGLGDLAYNLLGLLRDGQYELAYDSLMGSIGEGTHLDIWLFDVFVVVFGHQGFLEEALQILVHRKQARGSGLEALNLTYYVLDVCSAGNHYQGTIFGWNALVRNGSLQPSDGILENVLTTAAREGDTGLAAEVQSMISSRSKVQIHHYDAVVEAFVNGKDMAGAIRVLCIMAANGLPVSRENTRSIYKALCKNKAMITDAENAVRDMAEMKPVPLGAVAVVLEALVKKKGTVAAMPLYTDTPRLCEKDPSAAMIQDMIINSQIFDHTRTCLQDYKLMIPAQEKPPARLPMAYNKLITACLDFHELDLAFRFVGNARLDQSTSGREPVWLKRLTERAMAAEDARIWRLFDVFAKAGNRQAMDCISRVSRLSRMAKRKRDKEKEEAEANVDAKPILDDVVPLEFGKEVGPY
jgi:hypothetical protein